MAFTLKDAQKKISQRNKGITPKDISKEPAFDSFLVSPAIKERIKRRQTKVAPQEPAITTTGDEGKDSFIKRVTQTALDRKPLKSPLETLITTKKPKLFAKGFAKEIVETPARIARTLQITAQRTRLEALKSFEELEEKRAQDPEKFEASPEMAQLIADRELINAPIDHVRLYGEFRANNEQWIQAHNLDLTPEEQQDFVAKLGAGFASLPKSLVPGVIAVEVYADAYDQAIGQGKTDAEANKFALAQAGMQEATERIGAFGLGKVFKEGAGLLRAIGKGFASESIQETVQELSSVGLEKLFKVQAEADLATRLIDSFLIGGITGAGGVGGLRVVADISGSTRKDITNELVKQGFTESEAEEALNVREKEIRDLFPEEKEALEQIGFTEEETKKAEEEFKKGRITEEEITAETKPEEDFPVKKEFEETVIPETEKEQPLLAVAQVREILAPYDIKPETVKRVKEIIKPDGKMAAGSYENGVTLIANIAKKTTAAHEAFHQFVSRFVSDEAYNKAAQEIAKTTNITDEAKIEEEMAERFARYRNNRTEAKGFLEPLFNNVMNAVKRNFGSQKELHSLFKDFDTGKIPGKHKRINVKKFQEMPDDGKRKFISEVLKLRREFIENEITAMKNELEEAQAGSRVFRDDEGNAIPGMAQKSTFPKWFKDLGFKTKKQAQTAFNRGNVKFNDVLRIAKQRLAEGYSDKALGYAFPPSDDYNSVVQDLNQIDKDIVKDAETQEQVAPKKVVEKQVVEKIVSRETVVKVQPTEKEKKELVEKAVVTERAKQKEKKSEAVKKAIVKERAKKDIALDNLRTKIGNIKDFKKTAIGYAEEFLALKERGKLIKAINNIKTKQAMEKVLDRIDNINLDQQKIKARDKLKKDIKALSKQVKKFRPEYKNKALILLGELSKASLPKTEQKKIQRMSSYLTEFSGQHMLTPEEIIALDNIEGKTFAEMDINDIQLIEKTLKHLIHLNRESNKFRTEFKSQEREAVVSLALETLDKSQKRETADKILNEYDSLRKNRREFSRQEFERYKKITSTGPLNSETLDNFAKTGVFQTYISKGINDGRTTELDLKFSIQDNIKKFYKDNNLNVKSWSTLFNEKKKDIDFIPYTLESGKKIELTKGQRVALLLSSLNEDNVRHIVNGGISVTGREQDAFKLTQNDLDKIISDATPDEIKVAQKTHDFYNKTSKSLINKVSERLLGFETATVENYYPIIVNKLLSRINKMSESLENSNVKQVLANGATNFLTATLEGQGALKERTGSSSPIILEDVFVTQTRSIKLLTSYVGLAEHIRNAKMILNENEIQQKIVKTHGTFILDSLVNYVRDVEADAVRVGAIGNPWSSISQNLTVARLGASFKIPVLQILSYPLAGTEIKAKFLGKALQGKPMSAAEVEKISSQQRERFTGKYDREIGEALYMAEARNIFLDRTTRFKDLYMASTGKVDQITIRYVYKAAKLQLEAQGVKPENMDNALREFGDLVVSRTQPMFDVKDRSELLRSREFLARISSRFTSATSKIFETFRRANGRYFASEKTGKDFANLLSAYSIVFLVSGVGKTLMDEMFRFLMRIWRGYPKAREKAKGKESASFVRKMIITTLGNIPIFGKLISLASIATSHFTKPTSSYQRGRFKIDPILAYIEDIVFTIGDIIALSGELDKNTRFKSGVNKYKKKAPILMARATKSLLTTLVEGRGVPVKTIEKNFVDPALRRLGDGSDTGEIVDLIGSKLGG